MSIYLQIPNIDGDVTAKGHEQWIQLQSMQFQIARHLKTQPGRVTDREGARPELTPIRIVKQMDKTTPLIFSEACAGKAKPSLCIHLCTTNDSLSPYMEYTLSNVIFSGYHVETVEADYPSEQVVLSYDKIEMKYIPFDQNHKAQSPIPAAYDLKEATLV
jgi:type VI secretion system secreted protein Hcp